MRPLFLCGHRGLPSKHWSSTVGSNLRPLALQTSAIPGDQVIIHTAVNFVPQTTENKNALTAAVSLACLEIRSRNEEAINSTRNSIYSLKVVYFLLYRCRYFLFVSEFI